MNNSDPNASPEALSNVVFPVIKNMWKKDNGSKNGGDDSSWK